MSAEINKARSMLAHAVRNDRPHEEIEDIRKVLATAKIEQFLNDVLISAPPLEDWQKETLIRIIRETK